MKKLAVLGGGQLAHLLARAADSLGVKVIGINPSKNCSAALVTEVIECPFVGNHQLHERVSDIELITYEMSVSTLKEPIEPQHKGTTRSAA